MYPHPFLLFLMLLPCSIEPAIVQGNGQRHRSLVRTDRSDRSAAAKFKFNGDVEVHQSSKNITADVIKNTWDGRIFATSGLAGILMLLVGLYYQCKPSAAVFVDMSMLDEALVKEAAYLKRTENFPRPWTSTFSGALIYTIFLFAAGILLVVLLSVGISRLDLPCDACTHPGVIFVTISVMLYLWFIVYGILRWRKYFKNLPRRHDSILHNRLPKNTLEPTPMSMRPLYMSCFQYLWCMHNVYTPFFWLAVYRLSCSQVNAEVIRDLNIEPSKTIGKTLGVFMLETTAFLWFKGAEEEGGKLIGHFSSTHLGPVRTVLKEKGTHDIGACEIWVDLKERTAVRASIDNVEIKLSRAFVIVMFLMIGSGHAWLHAICSWAVLPESPDTFIRRMSLCTMFFNHLGFDGGLPILAQASGRKSEFLGAGNLRSQLFAKELPYNDKDNMLGPYQAGVQDFFRPELGGKLVPYSRFCAWAYLLYEPFLALLDAEPLTISLSPLAYFYHTILHCTDHWELTQMFNGNINDWASVVVPSEEAQNSEFGADEPHIDYHAMCPVFLLSAGGLSEDFPKLYNVYFRDGPDNIPFFKKVYALGKYLDPELAYHLQACIIK